MVPIGVLSGNLVLEAMGRFSASLLVIAPVAIALLGFGAWILSAPSDETRWSESWVRIGTNLGIGLWLVNLITEAVALWAWFIHDKTILPVGAVDRSLVIAILSMIGPGIILSSIGLSVSRALVGRSERD